MKIHDDPRNVTVTDDHGARAHAVRCFVVDDHWWVVELCGDGDHAAGCIERLKERLEERCALQLSVAPAEVRPDLGRPFYASMGFQNDAADDRDRYPMCWRPSLVR